MTRQLIYGEETSWSQERCTLHTTIVAPGSSGPVPDAPARPLLVRLVLVIIEPFVLLTS